jgi:hypothetical protein
MATNPDNAPNPNQQAMLQIMMAEYAILQSGRASTIFDATGRANLYIGSLSSVIVALAFVGQASDMGDSFFVFTLVLLVPLFFIGVTTFARILQVGNADLTYTRGMNRIRHFYTEIAPETARYFILPTHDDMAAWMKEASGKPGLLQPFLSTGGMVIGLNSFLAGAFVAILLHLLIDAELLVSLIAGIVAFCVSAYLHIRYLGQDWEAHEKTLHVLFPSPKTDENS